MIQKFSTGSAGLRRIDVLELARDCDVSTRNARRFLQRKFPARLQADGSCLLTEYENIETRRALQKMAWGYATGFTMQRKR